MDEAVSYLKTSISFCEQNKIACLTIIHGDGSGGNI